MPESRARWMEARERLKPGPLLDLVTAAGDTLGMATPASLVRLGTALDGMVTEILGVQDPSLRE